MNSNQYQLTEERDRSILLALWKWKLLTTAAIAARFFPGRSPSRAYNRLLDLKRYGLIEQRGDERALRYHWTLTRRGYGAIRSLLPDLKEDGYQSEHPEHDALVTACHLGHWLVDSPDNVRFFSEQQLRRLEFREYPDWVPKTEAHRPDGYWGLPNREAIVPVALEVELSRKVNHEYEDVGYFYEEQAKVHRVLWLISTKAQADRIQANIEKAAKTRSGVHDFVLLDQFREKCWGALIFRGPDRNNTVIDLLNSLSAQPRRMAGDSPEISPAWPVLDARKSYLKSRTSPILSPAP